MVRTSVWLKDDNEFDELFNDETKLDSLVTYLKATVAATTGGAASADTEWEGAGADASPWRKLWLDLATQLKPVTQGSTRRGSRQSRLRVRWDLLQAALLFGSLIAIPLDLAHGARTPISGPRWSAWMSAEVVIDALLALDIFVSAISPFYTTDAHLVLDFRRYACRPTRSGPLCRPAPCLACSLPAVHSLRCGAALSLRVS